MEIRGQSPVERAKFPTKDCKKEHQFPKSYQIGLESDLSLRLNGQLDF